MSSMNKEILDLHKKATVVDAHADALLDLLSPPARPKRYPTPRNIGERSRNGHIDLPRLLEGGVDLELFAVSQPSYATQKQLHRTMQLFDRLYQELEAHGDKLVLLERVEDVHEAEKHGKIAAMLSIEGGEAIEGDLGALRILYRLSLRAMTLTWNNRNQIADPATEHRTKGGLTNFGVELIEEMNKIGIVVDVSHISDTRFFDVIQTTGSPVIASHSNCRALCCHRRNLDDDMINALADNGGVVGITFVARMIDERGRASLLRVLGHLEHVAEVAGVEYVGFGSDFDGIQETPQDLEDVTRMPNLMEGLIRRGYSEGDIFKILGGNFLRVFKSVVG